MTLLSAFDGDVEIPPTVRAAVTTEPAQTNLDRVLDDDTSDWLQSTGPIGQRSLNHALDILDETEQHGDVRLIADVLRAADRDQPIGITADDWRVRTVCKGFGATVTGPIGVIVRAVENGLPASDGRDLVRRVDGHGLHMTGELRDRADELLADAAS